MYNPGGQSVSSAKNRGLRSSVLEYATVWPTLELLRISERQQLYNSDNAALDTAKTDVLDVRAWIMQLFGSNRVLDYVDAQLYTISYPAWASPSRNGDKFERSILLENCVLWIWWSIYWIHHFRLSLRACKHLRVTRIICHLCGRFIR